MSVLGTVMWCKAASDLLTVGPKGDGELPDRGGPWVTVGRGESGS